MEALNTNKGILITRLDVCHILNERAISLILQYGIVEKLVTCILVLSLLPETVGAWHSVMPQKLILHAQKTFFAPKMHDLSSINQQLREPHRSPHLKTHDLSFLLQ